MSTGAASVSAAEPSSLPFARRPEISTSGASGKTGAAKVRAATKDDADEAAAFWTTTGGGCGALGISKPDESSKSAA